MDNPDSSPEHNGHAAAWRALTVPVLSFVRPAAAARNLVSLSRTAFVGLLVLCLLFYATILVLLMMEDELLWMSPTTAARLRGMDSPPGHHALSLGDVWQLWHAHSNPAWLSRAEITLILVLVLGPLALLFLGWLNLPLTHASGSIWRSYRRAVRASSSILWPVTVCTLVGGAAFFAGHLPVVYLAFRDAPDLALFTTISISACLLAYHLRKTIAGIPPAPPPASPPRRCENCGYDLTHLPADGRCSECGTNLARSLDQSLCRPDIPWSERRSLATWCRTSLAIILHPTIFYRELRLRRPDGAEWAFAKLNYVFLGLIALLGLLACSLLSALRFAWPYLSLRDVTLICVSVALAVPLGMCGCWLGHRLMAALVFSVWLVKAELPDFRWAARVIAYESAFLWVLCAFWGLLTANVSIGGFWISQLIKGAQMAGPAFEALLFLGGTLVLVALWWLRYQTAYRAIRWSNF